ncbi:MAG: GGDEF domain-containing protein [Candidatus Sedimenticola sp. (ex Thyasira tokunagai)]
MTTHDKQTGSEPDTNAEILRLTLPLMSKYGIPATPENYAVWFHYASGDKPALTERIDELRQAEGSFSTTINDTLFNNYISEYNLDRLQHMRQKMQKTLIETSSSLRDTSADTDRYSHVLEEFNNSCGSANSLQDVLGLMSAVLDETRQMRSSVETIQRDFDHKSEEMNTLRKELNQVRQQASTDPLTGLSNRKVFFETLEDTIAAATEEEGAKFCLVMLDIDHFKKVNDTHGHLVGDKVIRFVADTLKKSTKGRDTAARYGGEEFTLLLPQTETAGAVALSENIRNTIADTSLVHSKSKTPIGQITISAGVALFRPGDTPTELVERADNALYYAKNHGRNQVVTESAPES